MVGKYGHWCRNSVLKCAVSLYFKSYLYLAKNDDDEDIKKEKVTIIIFACVNQLTKEVYSQYREIT